MAIPRNTGSPGSSEIRCLILTGCLSAALITSLSCGLPNSRTLTWTTIFTLSFKYIALATVGGAIGISIPWFFLRAKPWFSLPFLSKSVAVGWIFFPCIALLYRHQSPWMFLVLAVATVTLAFSVQGFFAASAETEQRDHPNWHTCYLPSLYGLPIPAFRPLREVLIAICAQTALIFAIADFLFLAGALLSTSLSLLVWRWSGSDSRAMTRLAGRRYFLPLYAFAFLVTVLALIPWVAISTHGGHEVAHRPPVLARQPTKSDVSGSEYIGIILWPPPAKRTEIVPPRPHVTSFAKGRASQPVVIPFYGPYWYFKAPSTAPGPHAHVAHGKPTAVNINSSNSAPLLMEAHQNLDTPIDLSCCSEIDIAVTNADTRPGKIALALRLTDSGSVGTPSQDLGFRTIPSSEVIQIPQNRPPLKEVLRFPISRTTMMIHRFDEITVFFLPSRERARGAAKVSVESLTLIPK